MDWRTRYEQRINSPEWRTLKFNLISQRGAKCERCEFTTISLEMHHKTYDRLGNERASDLELLCHDCHIIADKERAKRNAIIGMQRAYSTRYENAYNTYVSKKYGDNYIWGNDDAREEFDEWLERKESENY